MDLKELKNKTEKDLHKLLAENREKLRDLRFKVSAKQLKNIKEIKQVKILVARILTLLNQSKKNQKTEAENDNIKETK